MKRPAPTDRYQILTHPRPRRGDFRDRAVAKPRLTQPPWPSAARRVRARSSDARRRFMTGEDVMVPGNETDQLRQQLLHAQRLSSVGALASSVAHEFNNIL